MMSLHLLQSRTQNKVITLQLLDLFEIELVNRCQAIDFSLQHLQLSSQLLLFRWLAFILCYFLWFLARVVLGCLHIIMRMSRVRQFGELRSSRGSMRGENLNATLTFGRPTSANARYVCVSCVNHSLSQQKVLLNKTLRQQENAQVQQLQSIEGLQTKNGQIRSKRAEELQRRVVADNQVAMQACQQRRRRERSLKDEEKKLLEFSMNQYQKKVQQDKRRQALLREKWRNDIDQQLSLKRTKLQQQQMQEAVFLSTSKAETTRADNAARTQEERLEKYRNDLLNQIKDEQSRKQRQKLEKAQQLDIKGCAIIDRAEERTRRAKEVEAAQRSQIQSEKRLREQQYQRRRTEERRMAEAEQARQRAQYQRELQKAREAQNRRESQIRNYLTQIKQQMEDRERLRKTALINEQFQEDSFIKQRVIVQQRCDSCERPYPKGYLTRMEQA